MSDQIRVLELLEEAITSGKPAEVVCADTPELLLEVQSRLARMAHVRQKLDYLFPEPGESSAARPAPRASGPLPHIPGHEVEAIIGRGGMGVVYKARNLRLNRPVAVKMLLVGAHAGTMQLARFRREAKAIAALRHQHIVQVYEVGDLDGNPYFTMELVEGGNLADYLTRIPISGRQAAAFLLPVARAVQFAHETGVIHRDLKPANILLQAGGPSRVARRESPELDALLVPKITDFGLAKLETRADATLDSVTWSGAILGTPAYVAPELARGQGGEVGPPVDIYALGVILYEMLTGRPPFQGEGAVETLMQATELDAVPPARLVPRVPIDVQTICLKCLEKDPRKRYPSAEALADDLERFLNNEPIWARPGGRLGFALRWVRRHKAVSSAMAVAAAMFAILVIGSIVAAVHFRNLGEEQRKLALEKGKLFSEKEAERVKAVAARLSETLQRGVVEKQKEMLRRNLYIAEMNLASQAMTFPSGLGRVAERLADWEQNTPDLRDREWYYLKRLCHRDIATYQGHHDGVFHVAWSPDGKRFATGGADGLVGIWDESDTDSPKWLRGHAGVVASVAWSPDGTRLATAGWDSKLKVWDTVEGRDLFTLKGHEGGLHAVAWNGNGTRLATGSEDRTVRIWDASPGASPRTLRGHLQSVAGVAWSPDGKTVASAGRDSIIRLWDADSGDESRVLVGHKNWVTRVAWNASGDRLVSAGNDSTLRIWDPGSGKPILALRAHHLPILTVAWSPDGTRLVTGSDDQTVKVWRASDGTEVANLRGHTASVTSAAWSPDGTRLITSSHDRTVKVWDGNTSPEVIGLHDHDADVLTLSWSRSERRRLASASADGMLKIWDPARGGERPTLRVNDQPVDAIDWHPDGNRLASASRDGIVRIWDVDKGVVSASLARHDGDIYAVRWSPDGTKLASAGVDQAIRIWDVESGTLLHSLTGHNHVVHGLCWSPDGKRLATCSGDRSVRVWDVDSGREAWAMREHEAEVMCISWSPDGRWLVSGGCDQSIKLTDATKGTAERTFRGHTMTIYALGWNPSGTRIASTGNDRTVKVWDVATGKETMTLASHAERVNALQWSPDGHSIASASNDKSILIYDASAGYAHKRQPLAGR
ncbi:protein kinase domain-containing protein [Singulisphaera sp. PoT]|uniref:WD40 domain-containing protein n=1 Tax=Singulisphaera sp. PoT TaxID=3411797 RepID=UPI003BF5BB8A